MKKMNIQEIPEEINVHRKYFWQRYLKGIIFDKEVVRTGMPKRIEKVKIALINSVLEIEC